MSWVGSDPQELSNQTPVPTYDNLKIHTMSEGVGQMLLFYIFFCVLCLDILWKGLLASEAASKIDPSLFCLLCQLFFFKLHSFDPFI